MHLSFVLQKMISVWLLASSEQKRWFRLNKIKASEIKRHDSIWVFDKGSSLIVYQIWGVVTDK